MIKLRRLLEGVEVIAIKGNKFIEINNIYYDSKQLKPGGLFLAVKGTKLNGLDFIDEAIERGAVCVISEENFIAYKDICRVLVKSARKAAAIIANNFYEEPSQKIRVLGITGTNGKSTTLNLIAAILREAGRECATIGTLGYNIGERKIPAVNTTPSAVMTQMLLRDMVKADIPYCAMEVSSHSLHQDRVEGIIYRSAVFTNLSEEHLDYHDNMEEYFLAKKRLFDMLKEGSCAIINADDRYSGRITKDTRARVLTFGMEGGADISAQNIKVSIKGSEFDLKTPSGGFSAKTSLMGRHNVYNILAAVSFGISEGIGLDCISGAIRDFSGTPGRMQPIDCGQDFSVFVDYAHTEAALKNVLMALRGVASKRIIIVFGCGGDRDRAKRPLMARAAAGLADFLILTSDNPRSENPKDIIDGMIKGLPPGFREYKAFLDRRKAIDVSLNMACAGDIVLIAGKGHEVYQVFKDTTIAFDDRKIAEEILESKRCLR